MRLQTLLPMPAIAAILRSGLRLAVAATLALAVLLAGTGVHLTSHCSDHDGDADPSAVTPVAVELGESENGEDDGGLCLSCDCTCQTFYSGDALAIQMPAPEVELLVRPDGPVPPDGVVFEVEPPPVRVS